MTHFESDTIGSQRSRDLTKAKARNWQRDPWWIWITVFSFDAVSVATTWHLLFARAYHVESGAGVPLVLGCSVWVIYLMDHWLDAGAPPVQREPARKRFFRVHRRLALGLIVGATATTLAFARWLLDQKLFHAGILLTALVFVYFVVVHLLPARIRPLWPREAVVAGVFAMGVALPIWLRAHPHTIGFALGNCLFFLLCWLNCCSVEVWEWQECGPVLSKMPNSLSQWLANHVNLVSGIVAMAAFGFMVQGSLQREVAVSLCLSGLAFVGISLWRRAESVHHRTVRACALLDCALLSPLLIMLNR